MSEEDYKIAYENVMIENKMLEQEIERLKERENILQKNFSDWKKGIEKERKYYLCERTDCCGRIKDSKKYSSLYQKNKRLNNIINELEKWVVESIEKYTDDYLDWKYDRNVYLAGSKKLQNVLDKLQELKGSDKE